MQTLVLDAKSAQPRCALEAFKMRSPARDAEVDDVRISCIVDAIDEAIREITAERSGLIARVKTIVLQLELAKERKRSRDEARLSSKELIRAEERLSVLTRQIPNLIALKNSTRTKFPTVKRKAKERG